ncbi:DUF1653 domain-containing protein [Agitococcus lubricus]|uniref:Uncharacterized protein DUF1653 n=1 Tax=Agitococcus lubricus TaxID=1077255 RepID=A0A2T5IVV3_9GAMM|nr:DUF1653 domain-containing protein [Agitococcus lubricus]PTQ87994.1 uncharacterized protein DUF1653 [Agitococcus lubricus]
MTQPIVNGIYRHYKGKDYRVLAVARHSETEEYMVVYHLLYGDFSYWVRPLAMFTENIVIDGVEQARFVLLKADEPISAVALKHHE